MYNRILFSLKKEGNFLTWNIVEPGGRYAKWNKPNRERQTLYGIIYMWNHWKNKNKPWVGRNRVEYWLLGDEGNRVL